MATVEWIEAHPVICTTIVTVILGSVGWLVSLRVRHSSERRSFRFTKRAELINSLAQELGKMNSPQPFNEEMHTDAGILNIANSGTGRIFDLIDGHKHLFSKRELTCLHAIQGDLLRRSGMIRRLIQFGDGRRLKDYVSNEEADFMKSEAQAAFQLSRNAELQLRKMFKKVAG